MKGIFFYNRTLVWFYCTISYSFLIPRFTKPLTVKDFSDGMVVETEKQKVIIKTVS